MDATFRPLTTPRGLELDIVTGPGVPTRLHTDEQRLRQVLRNLVSNAVKFTEQGQVQLRIERAAPAELPAGVAATETVLAFRVVDTGIGIAEQHLTAIFDAFQQADGTTSRRYGGTGLGLSISREIAQLLGGQITAQSVLGRGSTFTLYLPASLPGALPAESVGGPLAVGGTESDPERWVARQQRRVLVLEPREKGLLTLLTRGAVAETGGPVEVGTAVDAPSAVGLLRAARHHLLVVQLEPSEDVGAALLTALHDGDLAGLPVLAYHGQPLAPGQETLLRGLAADRPLEIISSLDELRERVVLHLSAENAERVVPFAAPAADRAPAAGPAAPDLAGRKVLVVDDDARNVFALTNILELHGLDVVYAENGRKGIETLMRHDDIDLVLMDVMMPEMDGYAATAAIRAMPRYAQLPIIAVTAKAMRGDREKSISSGASDYVTKPVDAEDLLTCIHRWLSS
ncbi:ATP-binding protein [Micromonospora auratinigra]|uniref:Circadian input-output histidine kinase CikA n=1 Tax=Micromonospora auratinigra TaxID=261654 RepID=A0A1A8ZDH9_9ACTN|nr:ATP-binding protein [Micromonospora auratinigra]SBT41864.1 Histidine kinase-, DNA gyrase B-, and HSP90-like ATPase [Micromonospora auratinigra]